MLIYGRYQSGRSAADYTNVFWKKCLVILLAAPLLLASAYTDAAQISFTPNGATVTAAPGEVVSLPLAITLSGAQSQGAFANFNLAQVGGNLNRSWINNALFFSLNARDVTYHTELQISVPGSVAKGSYKGVFRTMGLRASEPVPAADFVINLEISKTVSCDHTPTFSEILSADDAIQTRNNKQVTVDLSGSVLASEGCTIDNLWYQLVDEYGELDHTENVMFAADGTFKVSIPMVASRKGNDKDGRLYSVLFKAENEAGVAESAETRIVVMHDGRKE